MIIKLTFCQGYQFEVKPFLIALFKIYRLLGKAEQNNLSNPVEISLSGDGAELTSDANHCSVHIKICDKDAVDPRSGQPLWMHSDSGTCQSREHVYTIFSRMGKDSKEVVDKCVHPVYQLVTDAVTELGWSVKIMYSGDMKWHWNCIGQGGGCKSKRHFCYCCDTLSEDQHIESQTPCAKCADRGLVCYHRRRLTQEDCESVLPFVCFYLTYHSHTGIFAIGKQSWSPYSEMG